MALLSSLAAGVSLITVNVSPAAAAAPEDVSYWTRTLRGAPIARASQWTPPGIQPIVTFAGVLALPPAGNAFTGSLPVTGTGAWRSRLVWNELKQDLEEKNLSSYTIFLGRGPNGFPQAALRGFQGSDVFVEASQPGRCELDDAAMYCAAPELDEGGFMASETFYGLTVRDLPAVVSHWGHTPNGPPAWGVDWYNPDTNFTYSFDAFSCFSEQDCIDDIALKFGPSEMAPENRAGAELLATFASSFVDVSFR
jgi:hypothetical protein